MHILLTRPLEDCSELILNFKSLGHRISHLPLLNIEKMNYEEINFSDYGGIIFTSANALKFLKSPTNSHLLLDTPENKTYNRHRKCAFSHNI